MKITIAYKDSELPEVAQIVTFVRNYIPWVTVRKSDRHPPFKHIYLTTKKGTTKDE